MNIKEKLKELKFKILIGLVISVLFFVGFTSLAYADFQFKPVKGQLTIIDGAYYNSNPGYAYHEDSRESQWGNKLDVITSFDVPFLETNKYAFNSNTSWFYYTHKHSYDNVTTNVSHYVDLVFNDWLVNVHHNFLNAYDPDAEELLPGDKQDRKFHKQIQYPGITVRGDLGKLKLTVGGDYQNYSTNEHYTDLERENYSAYLETAWDLTPLMDVFQKYTMDINRKSCERMNDSFGHKADIGIRGRLTSYLSVESAVGYTWVLYDENNNNNGKDDFTGVTYSGMINNTITPLTTQNFTFSYAPQQSYNVSNYYRSYLFKYNIMHKLNSKLNINGSFLYGHSKEDSKGDVYNKAETCHVYKYTSGLTWNFIKNTNLVCDYAFTNRCSDVKAKSYRQHIVSLGIGYNF